MLYIPNLSAITINLRNRTKKDPAWEWTETHEQELITLKIALTNRPVLQRYSPKEPLILSVDSSKDGMGQFYNSKLQWLMHLRFEGTTAKICKN